MLAIHQIIGTFCKQQGSLNVIKELFYPLISDHVMSLPVDLKFIDK